MKIGRDKIIILMSNNRPQRQVNGTKKEHRANKICLGHSQFKSKLKRARFKDLFVLE